MLSLQILWAFTFFTRDVYSPFHPQKKIGHFVYPYFGPRCSKVGLFAIWVFVSQLIFNPLEILTQEKSPDEMGAIEAVGLIYIPNWTPELYHER